MVQPSTNDDDSHRQALSRAVAHGFEQVPMPVSLMDVYERWNRPEGLVEVITVVTDEEAKAARWLIVDYDSGEHGPRWSHEGSVEQVVEALFSSVQS